MSKNFELVVNKVILFPLTDSCFVTLSINLTFKNTSQKDFLYERLLLTVNQLQHLKSSNIF